VNQDYYWTPEWQRGEKESRKELAAGRGITFRDGKAAARWLVEDDSTTTNTPATYLCAPGGEP